MKNYVKCDCVCGKQHSVAIDQVIVGCGAIKRIPEFIKKYSTKKIFVLADINTFKVAGNILLNLLDSINIPYSKYVFSSMALKPDEYSVGSAIMHFDKECDLLVCVGSGVLNDIGKILSNVAKVKYIVVATAPSMDGYASASSSMDVDGLKVSLQTRSADVIIGDTDILKKAPIHMLKAGIGDMLAKYISIAEWRIANLITGEYYCEEIASMVRKALKKCVENAEGLLNRDQAAIEAVFEGLVICGIAMSYAGLSRPASGVEHYFSHVWDMRQLEFGTKGELHGIQCAMGTLVACKLYDEIKKIKPDYKKAEKYVSEFDLNKWNKTLSDFLGRGARAMIALEQKESKYDKKKHKERFNIINERWNEILEIIKQEIPSYEQMSKLLDVVNISKDLSSIEVDKECAKLTFKATKDIRDKYVLSRLAWDLGILDEISEKI